MDAITKACPMCGADAPADAAQCECGYTFSSAAAAQGTARIDSEHRSSDVPGSGWQLAGWALSVLGLIALVSSLYMQTTVETYTPSTSFSVGGSSEIVNLDLLFRKGVAVACSLAAVGSGIFCLAIGSIIAAINQPSHRQ